MEYTKVHKSTHSEFFYVPPYMKNMIFTIKKVYYGNKTILFFYPQKIVIFIKFRIENSGFIYDF